MLINSSARSLNGEQGKNGTLDFSESSTSQRQENKVNELICSRFGESWIELRSAFNFIYFIQTLAGCPNQREKVQRLLNITILEENANFTENDIFLIFSMLSGSSTGYSTLFSFLQENWEAIKIKWVNSSERLTQLRTFSNPKGSQIKRTCGTVWLVQLQVFSQHRKVTTWLNSFMSNVRENSAVQSTSLKSRWKTSKKKQNGATRICRWLKSGWTIIQVTLIHQKTTSSWVKTFLFFKHNV